MVPIRSGITFFQVGAVNNGRNWARIAIMGSEWGMNFLLGKMSFGLLLSYVKGSFIPGFPTQNVQSRTQEEPEKDHHLLMPNLLWQAPLSVRGIIDPKKT
jgi:hypothetical protein